MNWSVQSEKIKKEEVKKVRVNYLINKNPIRVILTSGASCPDAVVDGVLDRLLSFFENTKSKEELLAQFTD